MSLFFSIRIVRIVSLSPFSDQEMLRPSKMASGNHDVFSWHANARTSKYVNSNRMANLDVFDKRFLKSYQEHKKLHESTVSFCCTSQLSMLYGGSLKHGDLSGLLLVKAGPQASQIFLMASKSSLSGLITIAMEDTASWTPSTAAPAKNLRIAILMKFKLSASESGGNLLSKASFTSWVTCIGRSIIFPA